MAVALIGLLALPRYQTSYDARHYMPADAPANVGAAAERHFSQARLNPELVIEADHDLRNSTDMILLERVAEVDLPHRRDRPGAVDHPAIGTPLTTRRSPSRSARAVRRRSTTCPFQQARTADLLKQVGRDQQFDRHSASAVRAQQQSSAITDEQSQSVPADGRHGGDLRDKIANFDDQFRPIRNYFYWEPHCFDIPMCAALRSVFDALDGIDDLTDQLGNVVGQHRETRSLQPKPLALIPPQIASQETNRDLTMTNYATNKGLNDQAPGGTAECDGPGPGLRRVQDRRLVLPTTGGVHQPGVPVRGMNMFLSPDGKAAR